MPMPPYPIYCHTPGCKNLATHKIAGRWHDGVVSELKTYSLSCAECLAESFRLSRAKHRACRLAPGESLDAPGIYLLQRGQRDQQLRHLPEVEEQLIAASKSTNDN